jgi:hypothetical protein
MGVVYEILRHPYCVYHDFDRNRRVRPEVYGRYKPTALKRFQCWLLDEPITPVNWEEVPPYSDNYDKDGHLVHPREGKYVAFQCVSQPDMISENNMYARFTVFGILWIWFYRYLIQRPDIYPRIPWVGFYFQNTIVMRMVMFGWLYYIISRNYINRNNQLTYN